MSVLQSNAVLCSAVPLCAVPCCAVQALTPGQGESVAQLHARYVEALTALGKQHNVSLDIVE
jgi:hypothetical protein